MPSKAILVIAAVITSATAVSSLLLDFIPFFDCWFYLAKRSLIATASVLIQVKSNRVKVDNLAAPGVSAGGLRRRGRLNP
jgi:hypothetical protein